ncbi:hypothetical protein BpHYR1_022638 [Brachionus plicatilis]|uniref:Uncharacterized protein n=1 Tax=Brachionus plicatilis TaxID=10195 RepID=A0A3M7Q5S9_BRAPC|nr:hypothetical protein BpHYR1_022638 [Brachionus plicatilis]
MTKINSSKEFAYTCFLTKIDHKKMKKVQLNKYKIYVTSLQICCLTHRSLIFHQSTTLRTSHWICMFAQGYFYSKMDLFKSIVCNPWNVCKLHQQNSKKLCIKKFKSS